MKKQALDDESLEQLLKDEDKKTAKRLEPKKTREEAEKKPQIIYKGFEKWEIGRGINKTITTIKSKIQQLKKGRPQPKKKLFPVYPIGVTVYSKNKIIDYLLARKTKNKEGQIVYKTTDGREISLVQDDHIWHVKRKGNIVQRILCWEENGRLVPFSFKNKGFIKQYFLEEAFLLKHVQQQRKNVQRWQESKDVTKVVAFTMMFLAIGVNGYLLWQGMNVITETFEKLIPLLNHMIILLEQLAPPLPPPA